MTRLRKDQTEDLLTALESATSGAIEEIAVVQARLVGALRVVLDRPSARWRELVETAAEVDGWDLTRTSMLLQADAPDTTADPDTVLWELWDLVTELSERRTLGPVTP